MSHEDRQTHYGDNPCAEIPTPALAPDPERFARERSLKMAQKWALVQFVLALSEREAKDRAEACEANGWRMSSAHDLYDAVIDTLTGLVTGQLDAEAYLEAERQRLLAGDECPGPPECDVPASMHPEGCVREPA